MRKIAQRPRRQVLEHPRSVWSTDSLQFMDHTRRDFLGDLVGDDRDLLSRLHAQTNSYCVASSGGEFRIKWNRIKIAVGLTNRNAHYPTFLAEAITGDSVNPTSVSSMM